MGKIVLCHDQQAGGVLVNAVDDSRALFPADAREAVSAVPEQRVHQRSVRMAGGRVNHHPAGFVDHDEIPVFIDDVQRDLLGKERDLFRFRKRYGDFCPRFTACVLLYRPVSDPDRAFFDQALRCAPAQPRDSTSEESVDSLSALLGNDGQNFFIHILVLFI